jgi:pimeloyl-ACP methyl ester carboxylesterase
MGASIATTLATRDRARVLTLTLATSSPGGPDLPAPSAAISASFAEPAPPVDPTDRAALVTKMVADLRLFTGTLPFDEEHVHALVERIVDRSDAPAAADNHWMLVGGDDGDEPTDLASITVPTLVWHGSADPLFPLPHGRAYLDRIPNARLVVLDGVGHEYPPPSTWGLVVTELLAHTAQGAPVLR